MKKLFALVLALLLAMSAFALAEDDIYIALFPKACVDNFWVSVEAGANAAAADLGVTITFNGPNTETDLDGQIKMIEDAIMKGADAIAVAPLDSVGNVPVVEEAIDKGIPVITFNSKLSSDLPLTHVATNNWAAGELAGKALGEAMGGKGKYAVLGNNDAVTNNRDRSEGCISYITEHFPEMELVASEYCEGDMNKGISISNDLITANPDIGGFFTNNETTTIAFVSVLQERGLVGKMVHVGFDATVQTADYIRDGITSAIITQVPYRMGYMTVEKALAAINGEELEDTYDTGCDTVTIENLDSDVIQDIIFPQGK